MADMHSDSPLNNTALPTLLIADAYDGNPELMADILAGRYQAVLAHTGQEAIDAYKTHHPNISGIITGYKHRDMTGTEMLQACHAISALPPVILWTGYRMFDHQVIEAATFVSDVAQTGFFYLTKTIASRTTIIQEVATFFAVEMALRE
jgi:Response regulator containing CheY-like receiver, AAA-type ATPase, and DNA-binding domains